MIEDVDGVLIPAPPADAAVPRPAEEDCYVVPTDDIAPLLEAFVQRWNRTRPNDSGQPLPGMRARRRRSSFVSALDWLEQETGAYGTAVSRDRLKDIKRGSRRRRYTPLAEADAIVTALGVPHLIAPPTTRPTVTIVGSGTIRVLPHPRGCGRC